MTDWTLKEQEIELDCIEEGIANYKRTVESRPLDELTVGKRAIKDIMANLVIGIEKAQQTWLSGGALHNGRVIGKIICGIPAPDLALMTLSVIYNIGYEGARYTYVAGSVGKYVDRYLQTQQMKEQDRKKYKYCLARFKNINDRKYNQVVKIFDGNIEKLTAHERMHIGAFLLNVAIEYTDKFDYTCQWLKRKRVYFFSLKEEVRQQIEKDHDDYSILRPIYKPMVVLPKDWTCINDGGYLFLEQSAVKESIGLDNVALNKIRGESLEYLYPYLNLLQGTQWQINTKILDVLNQIIELGGGIAGLPRRVPYEFPARPYDIDTNEESKSEWKAEAALVYSKNAKLAGQNVLLNLQQKLAEEYRDVDTIYYPWTADFRVRSYPSCTIVSPQSSDVGKSLLCFRNGFPLGEHGFKWLSISLCNNIGEDKLRFEDRVQYVMDLRDTIERCVRDPINNTEWMRWDEPFRGLAAAFEWVEAVNSDDPTTYLSRIPVAVDGTCNGFQHYAALGRDSGVGRYTNLLPSDTPDSIYTHVANAAILINEHDCNVIPFRDEDGDVNPCYAWQGNIGKPLVKQPTMTTPYSVTSSGILDQIYENVDLDILTGKRIKNLHYARDLVQKSIREVAFSADEIMTWLREIAKAAAKENKNLVWTTPVGVKVVQRYPKFSESVITTEFHKVYWRDPRKDTQEKISPFKHCNGVAPNFIHSLDASHMMMTMKAAHDELGITDFCMVHDSYGVHAGHMERFHQIIREQFVELHRTNWLERLYEEVSEYLETEISPPPEQGTLNIEDVLNSLYMFH